MDSYAQLFPLHAAAHAGDLASVQRLQAKQPELLETCDKCGQLPVHLAAGSTCPSSALVLRFLLEVAPDTAVGPVSFDGDEIAGWLPLTCAAHVGNAAAAELLVGAAPEALLTETDVAGHRATPCEVAAAQGHEKLSRRRRLLFEYRPLSHRLLIDGCQR